MGMWCKLFWHNGCRNPQRVIHRNGVVKRQLGDRHELVGVGDDCERIAEPLSAAGMQT